MGTATPHDAGAGQAATTGTTGRGATSPDDHAALMIRYSGLHAPVDGVFTQIARLAALVLRAPIVTVNIADDARVWFPAPQGPADGTSDRSGPSPSASLRLDQTGRQPTIVHDTTRDSRTAAHPWVTGGGGVRFLAVAPIVLPTGRRVGTLEVMDHKRRRATPDSDAELLQGLAATIAQLLEARVTSLEELRAERAERAAETRQRDDTDNLAAQTSQDATATRDRQRPRWCQLGGDHSCTHPAELKIADSWGDTAWGCWEHAEDALIQVPSSFLASEVPQQQTLDSYRHRRTRP